MKTFEYGDSKRTKYFWPNILAPNYFISETEVKWIIACNKEKHTFTITCGWTEWGSKKTSVFGCMYLRQGVPPVSVPNNRFCLFIFFSLTHRAKRVYLIKYWCAPWKIGKHLFQNVKFTLLYDIFIFLFLFWAVVFYSGLNVCVM